MVKRVMKTVEEDLKQKLKEISPWVPEWEFDVLLPELIRLALGVGIIAEAKGYYTFTRLAASPEAWEIVWKLLEVAGLTYKVEGG